MSTRISSIDMKVIDKLFQMEGGYVLDFSNLTMSRFFAQEINIDVDDQKYETATMPLAKGSPCNIGSRIKCTLELPRTE
jgi:hypothetical protein